MAPAVVVVVFTWYSFEFYRNSFFAYHVVLKLRCVASLLFGHSGVVLLFVAG